MTGVLPQLVRVHQDVGAHADAQRAIDAIAERLPLLAPEQEVALLQEAGFDGVELFYAGFSFKGWVAYAG